ncbi:MAG: AMP-binding protein [Alphaproteobacteria bacterium]
MTDSRLPSRDDCVLHAMLERRAAERPDDVFVQFDSGAEWSYAQTRHEGRQAAAALARLGVARGDAVIVWLPNGPEILRLSLGLSYLGAVFVPINLALRGTVLEHIVGNSGARFIIAHRDLIERLASIRLGALETIVVVGAKESAPLPLRMHGETALRSADDAFPMPDPPIEPWDVHAIFYTSGTTGPSKGVLCPHVLTWNTGVQSFHFLSSRDRFLVNLPYFHIAGAMAAYIALHHGGSMAMMGEFRTAEFWDKVRRTRSTTCLLLGSIASFLMKQPARADDRDHPMRTVVQQPLVHETPEFARRFDVTIYTQIDMTEMGPAVRSEALSSDRPMAQGYCGRVRPGMHARVVDAFDREVPPGEAGELVARSDVPWLITPGYHRMPEATAKAWRNGWFHTGDAVRREADGSFYFVDRIKDAIRRRGENISSAEVEAEVLAYDAVEAAAAVAAASEHGEDEVLVAIQPKPGATIDPAALLRFLIPRMPHFMVPRYVRVMAALPRTETGKAQKSALRADGVTPDTWDREKAGIVVKRQTIG